MVRQILLGKYRGLRFGFIFAIFFIFFISSLSSESNGLPLVKPLVDSPAKTTGSDFNGDGIHDLLMGAPRNDDGPLTEAGAVYILYGPQVSSTTYRLDGAGVNVTVLGKAGSDFLGTDIASAGDLNADGFDDIVMGAHLNDDGAASDSGAAYILYGSPILASDIALDGAGANITIIGKTGTERLGYRVSTGGDINGDGFDDLLVGAQYSDDGPGTDSGSIFVLYGSASLSADYDIAGAGVSVTITGKAASDSLSRCASTGDVNRDGFDDIVMGAPANDDGASPNAGALYVLFGGSSLAANIRLDGAGANMTLLGKAADDNLGTAVNGLGDVNGDGFDDFIGSAQYNNDGPGANDDGAAYIIFGRVGLANATLDTASSEENVRILGKAALDNLGGLTAASAAGDVNDDGFADILAGSRKNNDQAADAGAVYIVYGSTSLAASITAGNNDVTLLGKAASDFFGFWTSSAGDLNNDGIPDFVGGAYYNDDIAANAGAAYVVFGSESLSSALRIAGAGPDVTVLGKAGSDFFGRIGRSRGSVGP